MARFVVVLPLVALTEGDDFAAARWPLHVTLVEPFPTSLGAEEVAAVLGSVDGIGREARALHARGGEPAMFGRRHDVPVTLVVDGGELAALRGRTIAALQHAGVELHPRPDYRPHVTRKDHGRVRPGDRIVLGTVALVDLRPPEGAHHRRVVAAWPLGT
ncbi:2'-5' RNA ligase family protein [Agromyces sp. MMS24-K17]|uniref:2'-5' RNA ligase family protein n=1 Tax=Agromyces sp. MMS24-K17 TaxID=3372850 RepID=UPI0037540BB8